MSFFKKSQNNVNGYVCLIFLTLPGVALKSELAQKYAFNKKSTIFTQLFWDLAKMMYSWVGYFDQVSLWLGRNCGFFNKSIFMGQMPFLLPDTVSQKLVHYTLEKNCENYFRKFKGIQIIFLKIFFFFWKFQRKSSYIFFKCIHNTPTCVVWLKLKLQKTKCPHLRNMPIPFL